jgi:hypothetical protein
VVVDNNEVACTASSAIPIAITTTSATSFVRNRQSAPIVLVAMTLLPSPDGPSAHSIATVGLA